MSTHLIARIRLAHCKRGPERCPTCREWDGGAWCLLDVDPPGAGRQQRRTLEVELEGRRQWREFDVIRVFADERQARDHGQESGTPVSEG